MTIGPRHHLPSPSGPSHVIVVVNRGGDSKVEVKFFFAEDDTWGDLKDKIAEHQHVSRERLLLTYEDRPVGDGTKILEDVKKDSVHVQCTVHGNAGMFTRKVQGTRQ